MAVVVEAFGQPALGHVAGELGGVALERLPTAVGLEAAPARAVAGTGWPLRVHREVPQLGPEPVGPAEDLVPDDHAAAHAGAKREHHQQARRRVVHELGLGERGAIGVVVDEHRELEALL